jgi:hypothetical protein
MPPCLSSSNLIPDHAIPRCLPYFSPSRPLLAFQDFYPSLPGMLAVSARAGTVNLVEPAPNALFGEQRKDWIINLSFWSD